MARLIDRVKRHLPIYDPGKADAVLADLRSAASRTVPDGALTPDLLAEAEPFLGPVFSASPYLAGIARRDPKLLAECLARDPDTHLAEAQTALNPQLDGVNSVEDAMRILRLHKRRVALLTALANLGGVWDVMRVCGALSDAADASIDGSIRLLLRRLREKGTILDGEEGAGYFAIGMGKLGAHELNYSSDVDLIVFYDRARSRFADGQDASSVFVRLTRDLVRMLQERTADGYVFRTDLRLRPDPGATQVALSTEAGLSYYESFGQNWERAALVKARISGGDVEAGERFLAQLEPFVWRKYLDFATIADIHAMKRRVHAFKGHAKVAVAGHDVKLGRGGIREIEFFVQTQQLIAGGRQPELRVRGTLEALDALVENGWIQREAADELSSCYRFLRNVEHRIQMVADEQTHALPSDEAGLTRIAALSGFETASAFADRLVGTLTCVQGHYERLFEKMPAPSDSRVQLSFRGDEVSPDALDDLRELGFSDPDAVAGIVRVWTSGRYAAVRSERARERLAEFLPLLLEALAKAAKPDQALAAFDRFLSELPAGVQLFSLLRANPSLLRLLADIMGSAPRLARVLSRRARALDAVLDPGFFGATPDAAALRSMVDEALEGARDTQDVLDRARIVAREQSFLIGVRVLSGTVTADQAGDAYARLAETIIERLQQSVEAEMARQHGAVAGGAAAVLALGKLGGREMTAASDLDLIVIYEFDGENAQSSGARPLSGQQYYARFTQRLISALSAQTAEGSIYEVDMRLRPSGRKGPVATRLSSFVSYQAKEAWTWEHLALLRARVISGPHALREAIETAIRTVLTEQRDPARTASDVVDMRSRIEGEKGTSDVWDIKQIRGGLVDLEFLTQYLQLVHAHAHPDVLEQNTSIALDKLKDAGVLAADDADELIAAARLYHNLTQVLRLCLDRNFDAASAPEGLKTLLASAAGLEDFEAVEAALRETLSRVHGLFEKIVAE